MRRDWSTTRRVWITAVVLAALVVGGGGVIWLLRGFALRATYRAEPGKLTLGIEAGVVPAYQGMELHPLVGMRPEPSCASCLLITAWRAIGVLTFQCLLSCFHLHSRRRSHAGLAPSSPAELPGRFAGRRSTGSR